MDSACRGYPESTPNSLHKDCVSKTYKIQLLYLHPQYPLNLLLLLLLRQSFLTHNILGRETLICLDNNDVFG